MGGGHLQVPADCCSSAFNLECVFSSLISVKLYVGNYWLSLSSCASFEDVKGLERKVVKFSLEAQVSKVSHPFSFNTNSPYFKCQLVSWALLSTQALLPTTYFSKAGLSTSTSLFGGWGAHLSMYSSMLKGCSSPLLNPLEQHWKNRIFKSIRRCYWSSTL